MSSDIELVVDTLSDLGWKINFEKSNLIPSDRIEYLGLLIQTREDGVPVLKVPSYKIKKSEKGY